MCSQFKRKWDCITGRYNFKYWTVFCYPVQRLHSKYSDSFAKGLFTGNQGFVRVGKIYFVYTCTPVLNLENKFLGKVIKTFFFPEKKEKKILIQCVIPSY